ncbi:MAG: hypothetical protein H6605_08495 [Flavobacteriales bacterium]|nr:hypothetical protein [Flavobacteriales bacterium]
MSQKNDLDKVDVYTKYRPNLIDARRVEAQPELKEPEIKEIKLEYEFPEFRYKVDPNYTPLIAKSYRATPVSYLRNNYVKAGFGNYTTPLLNIHLHNGLSRNYSYGLDFSHLSSTGQPKFKSFIDNKILLHGAKYNNGRTLSAKLGYDRLGYNFYGYDHDENNFSSDSVKQNINNVYGNLHFDNALKGKGIKTGLDFDLNRFFTREQSEFGFSFSNIITGKAGPGKLSLQSAFTGLASGPDSVKYFRQFLDLHPFYKLKYKDVWITVGANSTVFFDSVGSEFFLYPDFKVDYYVVPEKMKAFVGIGGDLKKGSSKTLFNENQFIANNQILKNQNTAYKIYGGIQGKLNTEFDYFLEITQQFIYDLPLYISDSFPLHKFLVVYDDLNLFTFEAGLNFNRFEKINLGTRFIYYGYGESSAYQRPDFEWNTSVSAKVTENLRLKGKFFVIGNRRSLTAGELSSTELKPIFDLNIGADYQYNKRLSIFADLNNVTNQTYQRWSNYPVYGLNGIAGITFSF